MEPNYTDRGNRDMNQTDYSQPASGGRHMGEVPTQQKGQGFAITSMVTGIVAVCTCCVWYLSIPLAIVSLVFGIIVLTKKYQGRNMALAGVICGGAALFLTLLLLAFYVVTGFLSYTTISHNYRW